LQDAITEAAPHTVVFVLKSWKQKVGGYAVIRTAARLMDCNKFVSLAGKGSLEYDVVTDLANGTCVDCILENLAEMLEESHAEIDKECAVAK
jgi:hypothetical protein